MRNTAVAIVVASAACGSHPVPPEGNVELHADSVVNPVARNREAVAAGERLFGSMNCDGCHGGGGLGFVGPNLVDGRWRYGGSDAVVYQSILNGRPQGMPAYGALLDEATIWQLVAYIKSQPVPVDVATEAWP